MSTKWTPDRIDELRLLSSLLNEASMINHGSGVVDRIKICEKLSEVLRNSDLSAPRKSFIQFLYELATDEMTEARKP